jgi:hypothetical protein
MSSVSFGVGFPQEDGDIVLTKTSAERQGFRLGFAETRVLAARENELRQIRSPGFTSTMILFDFPTMLFRDGKHVEVVLRYATLVDPKNGNVETVYWVLDRVADKFTISGGTLLRLTNGPRTDWPMHVDGNSVRLGVPRWQAFAVVELPPGDSLAIPLDLRTAAACPTLSADAAIAFETSLRRLLAEEPMSLTAHLGAQE